jgi:hypothetical protein
MTRFVKWLGIAAVGLGAMLALTVGWLFYDNPSAQGDGFQIDLSRLRAAATDSPGPRRIEIEELSHTFVPKNRRRRRH